jgi:outer membrane protein assembly factor BamB
MARSRPARFVYVAIVGVLGANTVSSQTPTTTPAWPQFRGPDASGIAAGSRPIPTEFGPSTNLLWKATLPSGHSSPAIWGDRIYLTSAETASKKLEVLALDKSTGAIVWRQTVAADAFERVHPMGSLASATPAVDGERVYAYFGSYGLVAYDLSGKLVWEQQMPVLQAPFGSGTSPVVAGDLVILNRQEPKDPFLIAVDRKTGKTVWKHQYSIPPGLPVGFSSQSTPIVVKQQVIVHGMTRLEAFDLATGEPTWWVTITSSGTSTPVASGDTIYVATWNPVGETDQITPLPTFEALLENDTDKSGTLSKEEIPATLSVFTRPDTENVPGATMFVKGSFGSFDLNKDGQIDKAEWEVARAVVAKMLVGHGLLAIKLGGTGDVTATNVLWKHTTSIPEVPSPIVYENRVYLVRNGGIVTCLDATSGKLVYRERLGAGGPYFASPVAGNGRLIVASGDGVISVFPAGDALQVLARNDFGESIFASPAIVDGVLYIRTPTGLSAFSAK